MRVASHAFTPPSLQARGHSIAQGLLALPPPNPYVVSCIDILGDKQSTPSIVLSCSRGVAWHCPVPELREPRVTVFVHLSVPWACESAATFIALRCILEVTSLHLAFETLVCFLCFVQFSVSARKYGAKMVFCAFLNVAPGSRPTPHLRNIPCERSRYPQRILLKRTKLTVQPQSSSRVTGLESSVSNTALYPVSGIRITINGFHDKMHVLVDAFAAVLCRMSMTQVLRTAIHGKRYSVAVYESPMCRRSLILLWKFSKPDTRRGNLRDRTSPPHSRAA
jgi:secreted Zn-dependent insulinase-like peptidase